MINNYELYIKNVYEGVSQAKLAKDNGLTPTRMHQIISHEKIVRNRRKNPKNPTIEDILHSDFDQAYNLHDRNGSIKIWRAIVRHLGYKNYLKEEDELQVINIIENMTLEEFLSIKGIGVVYADLFETFKRFLSQSKQLL